MRRSHPGGAGKAHDQCVERAWKRSTKLHDPNLRTRENVPCGSAACARTSIRVIGYASSQGTGTDARGELKLQAAAITEECERLGYQLIEVVHEREPAHGKARSRPGLAYALERISSGTSSGLIVTELSRLTRSAAELGQVIEWIRRSNARLIAVEHAFDSEAATGRLAADLIIEISRWELARLSERTRSGLEAARRRGRATGRPAVADDPPLRERIARMRAEGMTLQAIADRLNEEGVPTVRGGTKWRHSSIQTTLGYKRSGRITPSPLGGPDETTGEGD